MKKILIVALVFVFFTSCKKEYFELTNVITPKSQLASDFFPMAVGNEWIYQVSGCDSIEQNCDFIKFDTIRIIGDSIDGLDTFYLFSSSSIYFNNALKADSFLLIDSDGNIKFCTDESLGAIIPYNISSDTVAQNPILEQGYYHLLDDEFALYVPAGVFPVVNFQGQIYSPINNYSVKYYNNNYYSKNVGLVKFTYQYFSSQNVQKCELVSYSLN